jgi:ribosomal protein L13
MQMFMYYSRPSFFVFGEHIMSKTFTAKPDALERDWYLVDATGKTLGRLASEIALRLRGKHKPEYTPNIDTGDYIIVVNAAKLSVTGKKRSDKVYYRHTGYIGNMKSATFDEMQARSPGKVLEIAVKGMLPKGPLGRAMLKKLKIYADGEHQHIAQQPVALEI